MWCVTGVELISVVLGLLSDVNDLKHLDTKALREKDFELKCYFDMVKWMISLYDNLISNIIVGHFKSLFLEVSHMKYFHQNLRCVKNMVHLWDNKFQFWEKKLLFFNNFHRRGKSILTIKLFVSWWGVRVMAFNTTFNNISVISRGSVWLVEETEEPGRKRQTCS